MISLKDITKIYPSGVKAVDNLCLDIQDKDFVVLLGPSGSGKTTLLRIIAGLEDITAGELLLDGVVCNRLKPAARSVAMVFQTPAMLPRSTVYDNIAFSLKVNKFKKFSAAEIDARVREAADAVDMSSYLSRKSDELSGGQKQRAALARAIAVEPRIFLLDEPLSSMEPALRSGLKSVIKGLHQRLEVPFVYVTHDQNEAMTLATRIAVIKDGQLKQLDTPLNVYNKPADAFCAAFISRMNFLTESQKLLILGEKRLAALDKTLTVGIRPEHILMGKRTGDGYITFKAVINNIEELGAETLIFAQTPCANSRAEIEQACAFMPCPGDELVVKTNAPHGLNRGDVVCLSIPIDKLHFLKK